MNFHEFRLKLSVAIRNPVSTIKGVLMKDQASFNELETKYRINKIVGELFGRYTAHLGEEVFDDHPLWERIDWALSIYERCDPSAMRFIKGLLLFAVIRVLKPDIVIETGVASGISTLFILRALERNGKGRLYSIDLPNVEQASTLPEGFEPGWIVPEDLRRRLSLYIGDSRIVLPELLKRLGRIDMFLHDSLHTYDHMMYEYAEVWKYLRDGGVIASDDVDANEAFKHFVERAKGQSFDVKVSTNSGLGLALFRKLAS